MLMLLVCPMVGFCRKQILPYNWITKYTCSAFVNSYNCTENILSFHYFYVPVRIGKPEDLPDPPHVLPAHAGGAGSSDSIYFFNYNNKK